MSDDKKNFLDDAGKVSAAIRYACKMKFGVLDSNFLCQSLSLLDMKSPQTVLETDTVAKAVGLLLDKRIGCVVVVDTVGRIAGIFTERDCLHKVLGAKIDTEKTLVSEIMTRDPIVQPPDTTIAYALNIMSVGGFRHVPIVDNEGLPVGIVSVKDVVDYIVATFTEDLLNFETSE